MNCSEEVPHMNISQKIFQSIGKFWNCHVCEDFKVCIDGEVITCHSFILASCSDFFKRLLTTNMKEKKDMKVDLDNIPMDIFQLILNTLYTGFELLTKDNLLGVWSAVHYLQIDFLIEHCEDFIIQNLRVEKLEAFKYHAELLHSERVSQCVFQYMFDYFMILRKTESLSRLNFEDILKLIESDRLVVTSEDIVWQTDYEWIHYLDLPPEIDDGATTQTSSFGVPENSLTDKITHSVRSDLSRKSKDSNTLTGNAKDFEEISEDSGSNDNSQSSLPQTDTSLARNEQETVLSSANIRKHNPRQAHLLQLLKATRYCLLSDACIAGLYQKKWIENDTRVKDLLFQASVFKTSSNFNGFCPKCSHS